VGIDTFPNPDLVVTSNNLSSWTRSNRRRWGWHNLERIARYTQTFRSSQIMSLDKAVDIRIAERDDVRHFTSLPWFSAMVVIRDQRILFERYANDFGPDRPHSIQSITKTIMNLVMGRLVELGKIDLIKPVGFYLPEIGTGYATALLQDVLNMNVVNDYTEDFTDPNSTYYSHEEAMGWRLPSDDSREMTEREFLVNVTGRDLQNRSGHVHYKDANTAVLAWVAERASGRPLREFLADIVDAAGIEGVLHITTDRNGTPTIEGGACLRALDLARYLALFVRRGVGVNGKTVGSNSFIEGTLSSGVPMQEPYLGMRYSNHTMVSGRSLGHGGWAGQYAVANLDTKTIGVFFSVVENPYGTNLDYLGPVVTMLNEIAAE
jgi:CubicO group peptidase (beta-lactamase class C family)